MRQLDDDKALSAGSSLDVLERSGGIRFDRSAPTITFGPCGSAPESFQVPLRMLNLLGLRAVLISAKINGQNSDKVLLDTGARVGYLSESLLGDAASDGEAVDFAPSFGGRIDTDKYVAEIALGGKPFVIPMAKMTPMMEWGAAMLGSSAFLGINGIFEEALCIDFQAGRVSMR